MKRVWSGRGLFETIRVFHGSAFSLDRHIRRLRKSCPVAGLKVPSEQEVRQAVDSIIQKNRLRHAALRLELFKKGGNTCMFVFVRGFVPLPPRTYRQGFSVFLEKAKRRRISVFCRVKSLDRAFYRRLSEKARRRGFDEALFLNRRGEVVEGARTNVFLVKSGRVMTPLLASGCLPGVTRAVVKDLLKRAGVRVVETRLFREDLDRAEEVFVTNALLGIMPVARLDEKPVGAGGPGPVCRKIMAAYKKEVEKTCGLR